MPSKQASERASKQARKQASERASERARKQASKQASTAPEKLSSRVAIAELCNNTQKETSSGPSGRRPFAVCNADDTVIALPMPAARGHTNAACH